MAFSELGLPIALGDEGVAVIPATYWHLVEEAVGSFETVVLMKVHRVFERVVRLLEEKGRIDGAWYVVNLGMRDQRVIKELKDVQPQDLNYFSMVIVKGGMRG
jgi:precorrin-2/cobalt-factor-2 C20-methyltransferase